MPHQGFSRKFEHAVQLGHKSAAYSAWHNLRQEEFIGLSEATVEVVTQGHAHLPAVLHTHSLSHTLTLTLSFSLYLRVTALLTTAM